MPNWETPFISPPFWSLPKGCGEATAAGARSGLAGVTDRRMLIAMIMIMMIIIIIVILVIVRIRVRVMVI